VCSCIHMFVVLYSLIKSSVSGPSLWVCAYRLGITKGDVGVALFLGSSLARKTCN
jgi:hypothetical protein